MRYVCLLTVLLVAVSARAQDGATVYKDHCATCHSSGKVRVPPENALRAMSFDSIFAALQTGAMKTVGGTLTSKERYAVAMYLSFATPSAKPIPRSAFCSAKSGSFRYSTSGPSWTGWSTGVTNTRFQSEAAAGLTVADVAKLKLKWAFAVGNETNMRSQPAVADGRVFLGTNSGAVYSLDARTGCIHWASKVDGSIRSALVIGPAGRNKHGAVYFGAGPNAYALDAATGKQLWKVRIGEHYAARITDAPLLHKGVLYFGISSFEEVLPPMPTYECCTFRGSVVALRATTGKLLWRTYTIAVPAQPTGKTQAGVQMYGPSGAGVWSTPTFDEKKKLLYVATGDNYSHPATETSDAVLALSAKAGKILWSRQLTSGDAYTEACLSKGNPNCPPPAGPDFDFGQPPILVTLADGQRELVLGQKSGVAYALDPDKKGAVLWRTRVGKGSALGGSEWGSASDGKNLYVANSDITFATMVPGKKSKAGSQLVLNPKEGGGLVALDLKTGAKTWSALPQGACGDRTDCSPAQSQAVSVIPGVVFSGSDDGHIRAYATSTGKILWDFDTARDFAAVDRQPAHGGSLDGPGPVIVNGMLFVSAGYGQWGGMPGDVLLAFSVSGQ